jgi:hypothetical protein
MILEDEHKRLILGLNDWIGATEILSKTKNAKQFNTVVELQKIKEK